MQLKTTQQSELGIFVNGIWISSIGQADDTLLLSDSIFNLQHLLHLKELYCTKYHVELVPEKTKLLCFSPPGLESTASYWKLVSPVSLGMNKIPFSSETEHFGIV